ncbi:MAG: glycosyltransferase family 4 protein [Ketobacteraceae bacterium]|nr:glycosyltransferase family 4 protein [Ketobacteraceae bacterium]
MTLKQTVYSPLASGNGAHVVHSILASRFPHYQLQSLSPKLAAFPQLLRSHRKKADIIHTLPEYGTVFFRNDAKNVVTFHNFFWDKAYQRYCTPAQRIYYRLFQFPQVRKAVGAADEVTTVSEFTAGLIREAFPDAKVQVIHNGVDSERFTPEPKTDDEHIRILFSGNVSRRKGGHLLAAIADRLPEHARLVITSGLRNAGDALSHPRIEFVNRIPYHRMQTLYQQCNLLLLPSYREGLSLSVLEAMSCGLPVISYNASSMPELINHGQGGYLADAYDMDALCQHLVRLISSREQMQAMGAYNRERILREFNLPTMLNAYEQFFTALGEDQCT